jgi:hypothetical protein
MVSVPGLVPIQIRLIDGSTMQFDILIKSGAQNELLVYMPRICAGECGPLLTTSSAELINDTDILQTVAGGGGDRDTDASDGRTIRRFPYCFPVTSAKYQGNMCAI